MDDGHTSNNISLNSILDFKTIFNATSNAMAFTEINTGRIVDVNSAWIRSTGISREKSIGMTASELGLWASRSEREQCISILERKGRIVDFEAVLIMKSEKLLHLISGEIIETAGIRYALWEFRNISEQKQINEVIINNEDKIKSLLAESEKSRLELLSILEDEKLAREALLESESRITSISKNFTAGMIYQVVVYNDGTRKFTYLSNSVRQLYGISPEEGMADSALIYNKVHEDDIDLLKKAEEEALRLFSTFQAEIRMREPSGGTRWSSLVSTPRKMEDGSIIWDGIEFIITERKLAEEALRESETKFSTTFRSAPYAMSLSRPEDGIIIDINDKFAKLSGYTDDELRGHTIFELNIWESPVKREQMVAELIKSGQVRDLECVFRRKTGELFFALLSAELITLNGKPCILSSTIDITERKQAEEKILQSLREKETLIRELYHRTKNTMQVISGMLMLQAGEFPENSELQNVVKITDQRIQAISLVHQMLYKTQDLSRISIKEYVYELTSLILQSFGISDDTISLNITIEEQHFLLDTAIPFGLILNELMTNSLKYAFPDNRKGEITIKMTRGNSENNVFYYSDNGAGVPAGFDFRKQNTLGLKLIYNIGKQQLHGNVIMENNNGVACTIEFPGNLYISRV